jgi:hypothetical protein
VDGGVGEVAVPAIMSAIGEAAGGAAASGAGSAAAGGAMTGLAGMGPEMATAATPAFSAGGGAGSGSAKSGGSLLGGSGGSSGSDAGKTAMQLLQMARAGQTQPSSAPVRAPQAGGGTSPSVQNFLKLLQQRNPIALRGLSGLGG